MKESRPCARAPDTDMQRHATFNVVAGLQAQSLYKKPEKEKMKSWWTHRKMSSSLETLVFWKFPCAWLLRLRYQCFLLLTWRCDCCNNVCLHARLMVRTKSRQISTRLVCWRLRPCRNYGSRRVSMICSIVSAHMAVFASCWHWWLQYLAR